MAKNFNFNSSCSKSIRFIILFFIVLKFKQKNIGGDESIKMSRNEAIMADAAHVVLTSKSKTTTGQFFIDDEVLASVGITNLDKYKVSKDIDEKCN